MPGKCQLRGHFAAGDVLCHFVNLQRVARQQVQYHFFFDRSFDFGARALLSSFLFVMFDAGLHGFFDR